MNKLKRLPTISLVCTKRLIVIFTVLVYSSTVTFADDNQGPDFQPKLGNHFKPLASKQTTEQALTLYCWLGSPSCYQLETALNLWSQTSGIVINYEPLVMRPQWRRLAKARLVAKAMSQESAVVDALYKTIHEEKQPVASDEALFMVIETLGISASRFANLFYSAEINTHLKAIETQTKKLGLRGVPSVIVNNQWLMDAGMLKTSREFILTGEYLITTAKKP